MCSSYGRSGISRTRSELTSNCLVLVGQIYFGQSVSRSVIYFGEYDRIVSKQAKVFWFCPRNVVNVPEEKQRSKGGALWNPQLNAYPIWL